MTQRNSPERAKMLLERRVRQEAREYGFWPSYKGARFFPEERPKLIPAWQNRRTGKPHKHERANSRRLRQIAAWVYRERANERQPPACPRVHRHPRHRPSFSGSPN